MRSGSCPCASTYGLGTRFVLTGGAGPETIRSPLRAKSGQSLTTTVRHARRGRLQPTLARAAMAGCAATLWADAVRLRNRSRTRFRMGVSMKVYDK